MADRPTAQIVARDFPGMVIAVDPDDLPPGAAELQVNLQSDRAGELRTRPGFRKLAFDEAD